MFAFLATSDAAEVSAAVDFAIGFIADRAVSEGAIDGEEVASSTAEADELRLGLRVIKEIEDNEGVPLKGLSEAKARQYARKLTAIVDRKIEEEADADKDEGRPKKEETGYQLLAKVRNQAIDSVGTLFLIDPLTRTGTLLVAAYLIGWVALSIYLCTALWPIDQNGVVSLSAPAKVFWLPMKLGVETRMLLLAALAGGLGSAVHGIRSLAFYAGNRLLRASWVWWFLMQPFTGMGLAVIFYFILRGVLSPTAGMRTGSYFAILAFSALVGMFSWQATQKLQDIGSVMFGSRR